MTSDQENWQTKEGLSIDGIATIAHQQRVWQVRKYCQVKPSIPQYSLDGTDSERENAGTVSLHGDDETADPALAALLRGVLKQLNADIVMISLLDDHTQFFLSGATSGNNNDAQVTLESARWYGCDEVSHHGGLCERTITLKHQPGTPAFYEVLDMSQTERTQTLPFVCGTIADFRHYAGMPITSPDGFNIGTVFAMSKTPSTNGINETQKTYLYNTTKHVMGQLVQAVQALEGRRAERYNEALSALLDGRAYDQPQRSGDHHSVSVMQTQVIDVYEAAAKLLHGFLDLSGLIFQELPLARREFRSPSKMCQDTVIASELDPGVATVVPMDLNAIDRMLEAFPHGGVLHIDDTGGHRIFTEASNHEPTILDAATNVSLNQSFPNACQILFTPLWDAVHNRNTALCVGWVLGDERVFRHETDLNAMSSFCMATVSLILRIESQKLEQVKSDFLGSISHETRSPLHNVLGNLELALDTDCSPQLREMLISARFGATQLLETIDKILLYSKVQDQSMAALTSQGSHFPKHQLPRIRHDKQGRERAVLIGRRSSEVSTGSGEASLVDLCEDIVEGVAKRMRLSATIMSPSVRRDGACHDQDEFFDNRQTAPESRQGEEFSIIVFDARSSDNYLVSNDTELRIILENLLSNAIKFTRSGYCVRLSLRLDPDCYHLDVVDCGRGFSQDFIKHNLFVPFSQQEPVENGIGLGLSLIKQNIEVLGGSMQFETDETLGSTFAVSVPVHNLTAGNEKKIEDGSNGRGGTAVIPPMPRFKGSELPTLKASVYVPDRGEHHDKRRERSIRLFHESLTHTLETWFQPNITLWYQGQDEDLPHLVFIVQNDLESFQKFSGEAFAGVKKVVVCADYGKNSEHDASKIGAASLVADAIITGSILPSKLWKVMTILFPQIVSSTDVSHERKPLRTDSLEQGNNDTWATDKGNGSQSESLADGVRIDHHHEELSDRSLDGMVRTACIACHKSTSAGKNVSAYPTTISMTSPSAQSPPRGDRNGAPTAKHDLYIDDGMKNVRSTPTADPHDIAHAEEISCRPGQRKSSSPTNCSPDMSGSTRDYSGTDVGSHSSAQPRLLLVDDNDINLKMLSMFVKKCGIAADSCVQASGGQHAIDLYAEAAAGREGSAAGFDIIFMDLSMPDVSGFEATSAIRRMEDSKGDRKAAEFAGTDEYITKPTGRKNVKAVIDKWKSQLEASLVPSN